MIKSLTALRGIFILFIFFHHCLDLFPGGGTMAVAFFFVLGGFSMTLGYKDKVLKPEFSYGQYLMKRCIKFYPLHWLCLLAIIPLIYATLTWKHIPIFILNGLLLHSWFPYNWVYFQFNSVSWYLADTLFFTVAFPVLFKWIFKSSNNGRVLIALFFAAVYVGIAISIPSNMHHAILYVSPYVRLADFVFGIYLALLYMHVKDNLVKLMNNDFICSLSIIILIVMLVIESCFLSKDSSWFAPVYWPLVALLILTTSLQETSGGGKFLNNNKYLLRIGELSFIFFMIHLLVLKYSTLLFDGILHFDNNIVYIIFTLILTILVSIVVEKYILKPITQWLTKKIQPSMIAHS